MILFNLIEMYLLYLNREQSIDFWKKFRLYNFKYFKLNL
jgi:hypothetical protein